MLAQVALRGKLLRGAALPAQKELARQLGKAGGDELWYSKDKQAPLRRQLAAHCAAPAGAPGAADHTAHRRD